MTRPRFLGWPARSRHGREYLRQRLDRLGIFAAATRTEEVLALGALPDRSETGLQHGAPRPSTVPLRRTTPSSQPARKEPRETVRRLRDFAALWASRSETQRAEMIRSVYARVEAEGPKFVAAHLTVEARELGRS